MEEPRGWTSGETGETTYRVAAAIGMLVGIAAIISPSVLVRAYGVQQEQNGIGGLGWRLFAVRNIYTAARALAGDQTARDAVMYMQPADIAVFLYSYRAGHLPLVTTVLAIASASAVLISSAIAKSAG